MALRPAPRPTASARVHGSARHGGRGHLHHAAEQALFRPAAQQHRAVGAGQPEGDAVPQRPLRLCAPAPAASRRSPLAAAAARAAPRAQHAARPARRADRGAEIHHRLGEIAGRAPRHRAPRRARLQPRLCSRQRLADGEEPGDDALDIAVDRRRRPVERDRRDRRRGVVADPGQRPQRRRSVGKLAAVRVDRRPGRRHGDCGRARNSRAPPGMQDLVERGRGQRRDVGPARDKSVKIGRRRRPPSSAAA